MGIPSELLQDIRTTLGNSAAFFDAGILFTVFNEERLKPFRGQLPQAATSDDRISLTVNFLHDKEIVLSDGSKQNVMLIFLRELAKKEADVAGGVRDQIEDVANRFENFLHDPAAEGSVMPAPVSRKTNRPAKVAGIDLEESEKNRLIEILQQQPYWQLPQDRVSFVAEVLRGTPHGSKIKGSIDLSGAPQPAAERTVNGLLSRGQDELKANEANVPEEVRNIPVPTAPELRKLMVDKLSKDELKAISFDLDINHENLKNDTKSSLVLDLIQFLQRRSRVPDLITIIRKDYPHVLTG